MHIYIIQLLNKLVKCFLKNTEIYKTVKYAPTVVIIDKGEIVAYTDMNSDEHKIMYGGDPDNNKENYDAFVVIDCEYTRTGQAQPFFENAKLKLNIDHHISNQGCVTNGAGYKNCLFSIVELTNQYSL